MRYKSVEFRIVQGENSSRSPHFSSQSCLNFYIDQQASGRTQSALMPWPGEKIFSAGSAGTKNRGTRVVDGVVYVVLDRVLYKILNNGVQTALATIPGQEKVSMADDGFNLMIRSSGTCAFINGKFILQGNGNTYLWNQDSLTTVLHPILQNDDEFLVSYFDQPTDFPSINIGNAILKGDALKQVYVYQRKIIMAGESSIEFFQDAGTGNPPIQAIQQASTNQIGAASSHSMAETPNYLYICGADGVVYRLVNFNLQSVTTSAIAKELRLADISDAEGYTCQLDGQWFYILQLPTHDKTFVYAEKSGEWTRIASGTSGGRHLMSGYVYAYGKHLVSDTTSSNVYEWDFDTYDSDGSVQARQFETAPINGLMVGAPGKRLVMSRIRLVMETGTGNSDILDPKVMIQASIDGGRTYGKESWVEVRREGDSVALVDWYNCISFYDLVLRVRVSAPFFSSFHSAIIDLKPAGD